MAHFTRPSTIGVAAPVATAVARLVAAKAAFQQDVQAKGDYLKQRLEADTAAAPMPQVMPWKSVHTLLDEARWVVQRQTHTASIHNRHPSGGYR